MDLRVTRFAPSPTGPLHLGHAYAAMVAAARGDRFLLRIEDIDAARCRPEWEAAILHDLGWLGLRWEEPVLRQSARRPTYRAALARLEALGVLYGCTCTRADIRAAAAAPQEGADGPLYPGTCRGRPLAAGAAVRIDTARAMALTGPVEVDERGPLHEGRHRFDAARMEAETGDAVIARRDLGTSYHLAVVVDDAAQGVTEVTRGEDLFAAAPLQVLLQKLLQRRTPTYWHHALIRDDTGRRLAKRDDARALALYRAEGASPGDVRRLVGL
jgi:glutamyl-Q tRNA(Asp) synthetase